jgi:hypothetical protein
MKPNITLSPKEVERKKQMLLNYEASSPIINDLVQAGFNIERISDLFNQSLNYQDAIPILIFWLPKTDNIHVKESIVRALSVPWAKPMATKVLIDEFSKANPNAIAYKWAVANAISIVADDTSINCIVNLVKDKSHGKAREMLTLALGNMNDPYAEEVLLELLDDDICTGYAIKVLVKLRSTRSLSKINELTNHPIPWVRKEAKKAILILSRSIK